MREGSGSFPRLISVRSDRDRESPRPLSDNPDENLSSLDFPSARANSSDQHLSSGPDESKSLSAGECSVLAALLVQQRTYGRNIELMRLGVSPNRAVILQEGWACASRTLPSGARQVLSVYVPGDIIGYPAALIGADASTSVVTLTDAIVSEVGIDRLHDAFEIAPSLPHKMMWSPARATAILEERLVSLGRRTARARTAHLFLELSVRLQRGVTGHSLKFSCPLSQYVIADALGLSAEHLNRVLRQLRTGGLLRARGGLVEIVDLEGLIRLADFDAGYLSPFASC